MTLAIFHEAGIPPRCKVSATISRIRCLCALATQATTPDGTLSSPGALLGLIRERALSTCSGVTSGIPLQKEERGRMGRGRDKRGACVRAGPTAGEGEGRGRERGSGKKGIKYPANLLPRHNHVRFSPPQSSHNYLVWLPPRIAIDRAVQLPPELLLGAPDQNLN